VVPLLELTALDPCYPRNRGCFSTFGLHRWDRASSAGNVAAPGLQTLASSPHERSEMQEIPDVIGLRLLEQLQDIGTHRRHGSRTTSQSRFLRFNRICMSNLRSYFSIRTYGIQSQFLKL